MSLGVVELPLGLEGLASVRIRVGGGRGDLRLALESLADAHRAADEQLTMTAGGYEAVGDLEHAQVMRLAAHGVREDLDRLERIIEREIEGVYDDPLPHSPHDDHLDDDDDGPEPVEPIWPAKTDDHRRVCHGCGPKASTPTPRGAGDADRDTPRDHHHD